MYGIKFTGEWGHCPHKFRNVLLTDNINMSERGTREVLVDLNTMVSTGGIINVVALIVFVK